VLLRIDAAEPESWLVARVAQVLRKGGVVVLPTDTVYSLVCRLADEDAIERLYGVKGMPPAKMLSILVPDIASAAKFTKGISNHVFRTMRRVLPGPYTFIFQASPEVPRIMLHKRRTIGVRICGAPLVEALLAEIGEPLLASSVRNVSDEFLLDPITIEESMKGQVELVVDCGLVANEPSTVVDLSGSEPVLVREGKGSVAALELFE
jgi:tRNA threonylcarbamoyl adenosine modification protein (Sua5/YciO/YrdC/YwlC family)